VAARPKALETTATRPETVNELLKRAREGDESTMPALWKAFEDAPILVEIYGNLARQAELSFIRAAAGKNLAFKEGLSRNLDKLRAELNGPNPTPIERLLVERVVACWLQVQSAEVRYAQAKDLSWKVSEFHQRLMDHSHKRYLSALKTLALVRKLAVPVLQVNIAKKQVNIAGPAIGKEGNGLE
jgi:hypothetical protein